MAMESSSRVGNIQDMELRELQSLVVAQREQLQQKEEEIRRLLDRRETFLDHRNPYQGHQSDQSNNSFMIHETMSHICEYLFSRRQNNLRHSTVSSSQRSVRQSSSSLQARFLHSTNALIVFFLILHYWNFSVTKQIIETNNVPASSRIQKSTLSTQSTTTNSYNKLYDMDESEPFKIKPWTSKPPDRIRLMDSKDPAILQRHTCIKRVRERQLETFQEFFDELPPTILLVDPAYHANVGDHMLTLGELEFIQGTMKREAPKQCHYVQSDHFYPHCDNIIRDINLSGGGLGQKQNLALWHAGGNWGDLWRDAQDVRIPSLKTLLDNDFMVVGMPQSLYYQDEELKRRDIEDIKRNVAQAPEKVVFTWREKESYNEAMELYPFVRNLLVPDIAFQLGPFTPQRSSSVDLLLLLRNDKESTLKRDDSYMQSIIPEELTYRRVDWPDQLRLFHTRDYFFTKQSIELLSLGRVVICDR